MVLIYSTCKASWDYLRLILGYINKNGLTWLMAGRFSIQCQPWGTHTFGNGTAIGSNFWFCILPKDTLPSDCCSCWSNHWPSGKKTTYSTSWATAVPTGFRQVVPDYYNIMWVKKRNEILNMVYTSHKINLITVYRIS